LRARRFSKIKGKVQDKHRKKKHHPQPRKGEAKPPSCSPEGESEKFIPDGKPLTLDFRPLTFDLRPNSTYHRMQILANSSEEMRWYKKVFRKEIRIIRIIISEINCF